MSTISKAYEPSAVEKKWRERWADSACFRADAGSDKAPYAIVIPPPNVTGVLHIGHVLDNTIQDVLARRARMLGKEVLWLPGTDHAGIATQTRVEKELHRKEGVTRQELGREAFLEKVWEWKQEHGVIIFEQLKRLGCSLDWSRERFTMDEDYSRSVAEAFVQLFEAGLIYRGKRMVNWCPVSLTALSDEEVIMKPSQGVLYTVRYEVVEEPGRYVEIATTRPETMMGDTGVAVHPDDKRYRDLVGKHCWRPFPRAEIPIVADEAIDPEFGTGVLKVTPAHDAADFAIGQRHGLPAINVFHPNGTLNERAGEDFEGLDRFEARYKVAQKLDELGLLVKEEPYQNNIGYSERADVPIEPRVSWQWFLRYPCVEETVEAVRCGEISFHPSRWEKTFLHWMENIQDWCISRQLWWGHQVPVWYRKDVAEEISHCEFEKDKPHEAIYVGVDAPADAENWVRDPDVLDTWFSSWLWPFATMDEKDRAKFYPTNDLVSGFDIIFFWIARMMMAGYFFTGQKPFSNIVIHNLIRDIQGRKMSKSLGNSPDALELMEKYGADGLRFGLLRIAPMGLDIRFDEKQIQEGRNFANKLWNASRYRQMLGEASEKPYEELDIYSLHILCKLHVLVEESQEAFRLFRLHEVAQRLYEFFWNHYCDWYLEVSKSKGEVAANAPFVMDRVLHTFLQLLHPFMPHLSEELWDLLGFRRGDHFLHQEQLDALPSASSEVIEHADVASAQAEAIYAAVRQIRSLKAEYGLAANKKVHLIVRPREEGVGLQVEALKTLVGVENIEFVSSYEPQKATPALASDIGEVYMPLEGLIDIEQERQRLQKERGKVEKELKKVTAKLSDSQFLERAPQEIIDENRQRQKDWRERFHKLAEMIEQLG